MKLIMAALFALGSQLPTAAKMTCQTGYHDVTVTSYSYFLSTGCTGQEVANYSTEGTWDGGGCVQNSSDYSPRFTYSNKATGGNCTNQSIYLNSLLVTR